MGAGLPAAEEPSQPSTVIDVRAYGGSEVIVRGYSEKKLTEKAAVYLDVAKSRSFEELTLGPAYYLTPDVEVGVSLGVSRFSPREDAEKSWHPTVSAFFYCLRSDLEASAMVEHYGDDLDPWYWCVYAHTPVTGRISAGFHAESGVGVGPLISWSAARHVMLFVAPILWRDSDTHLIVGSQLSF